jgi:hypothetical protein
MKPYLMGYFLKRNKFIFSFQRANRVEVVLSQPPPPRISCIEFIPPPPMRGGVLMNILYRLNGTFLLNHVSFLLSTLFLIFFEIFFEPWKIKVHKHWQLETRFNSILKRTVFLYRLNGTLLLNQDIFLTSTFFWNFLKKILQPFTNIDISTIIRLIFFWIDTEYTLKTFTITSLKSAINLDIIGFIGYNKDRFWKFSTIIIKNERLK